MFCNNLDIDDLEFYIILDWNGFTQYCCQMKELVDMGVWSKDILNSNDERQIGLLTGRTAAMTWNLSTCLPYAKKAYEDYLDWNVTIHGPLSDLSKKVNSYTNNGVVININSNNKGRTMMVLNDLYCNPDVHNLASMGIERADRNWSWTNGNIRRTEYIEKKTELEEKYVKIMASWAANVATKEYPYAGFSFDMSTVSTGYAAVAAAMGLYFDPLVNGMVDDVDVSSRFLLSRPSRQSVFRIF